MFKMLVLVCSTTLTPHACNVGNATDVVTGPLFKSPRECAVQSVAIIDKSALMSPDSRHFVTVHCDPVIVADAG